MEIGEARKKVKGATWFFASLIGVYLIVLAVLMLSGLGGRISMIQNLLISQGMIFIPTLVYIIITRCEIRETLRIRKTHCSAIFIVHVFVLALEPAMSVINSISLLWVDSATTELTEGLVAKYPFWVSTALMALTPCIVEELAYRGVILGSYRYSSRLWAIIVSGLLFGAMHMNFNQMAYAVVLGIMLGLLAEVTGSILPTMLAHFCFNEISVCIGYFLYHDSSLKKVAESASENIVTTKQLIITIVSMIPFAVGGLCVAFALLYALAVINCRKDEVLGMFRRQMRFADDGSEIRSPRIISIPLVLSLAVCIGFMVISEIL